MHKTQNKHKQETDAKKYCLYHYCYNYENGSSHSTIVMSRKAEGSGFHMMFWSLPVLFKYVCMIVLP